MRASRKRWCLKPPLSPVKPPRQSGFVMPEFRKVFGQMGLSARTATLRDQWFQHLPTLF